MEKQADAVIKDDAVVKDDAEFGLGMMLDDYIVALQRVRAEHGNLHVGVDTGLSPPGQYSWYGVLDPPGMVYVKKDWYSSYYVPEAVPSSETIDTDIVKICAL